MIFGGCVISFANVRFRCCGGLGDRVVAVSRFRLVVFFDWLRGVVELVLRDIAVTIRFDGFADDAILTGRRGGDRSRSLFVACGCGLVVSRLIVSRLIVAGFFLIFRRNRCWRRRQFGDLD